MGEYCVNLTALIGSRICHDLISPVGAIANGMELLDGLPAEQTQRRAELQASIDTRIDDIVAAVARGRDLRAVASSYQGNWRDVMVFVCAVLFAIVWWDADHHRTHWLPMFIALIVLAVIAAVYTLRGFAEGLGEFRRRRWN